MYSTAHIPVRLRQFGIACFSVAVLGAAMATSAQAQVNIHVDIGPPATRYEAVPYLAPGYVWAPGYWAQRNGTYVWSRGHQLRARRGYNWVPDRWEGGNQYRAGYWQASHGNDHDFREQRRDAREYRHERNREERREDRHDNGKGHGQGHDKGHDNRDGDRHEHGGH
jgi:hypothetical protein